MRVQLSERACATCPIGHFIQGFPENLPDGDRSRSGRWSCRTQATARSLRRWTMRSRLHVALVRARVRGRTSIFPECSCRSAPGGRVASRPTVERPRNPRKPLIAAHLPRTARRGEANRDLPPESTSWRGSSRSIACRSAPGGRVASCQGGETPRASHRPPPVAHLPPIARRDDASRDLSPGSVFCRGSSRSIASHSVAGGGWLRRPLVAAASGVVCCCSSANIVGDRPGAPVTETSVFTCRFSPAWDPTFSPPFPPRPALRNGSDHARMRERDPVFGGRLREGFWRLR
jgi:hypothetical protein